MEKQAFYINILQLRIHISKERKKKKHLFIYTSPAGTGKTEKH